MMMVLYCSPVSTNEQWKDQYDSLNMRRGQLGARVTEFLLPSLVCVFVHSLTLQAFVELSICRASSKHF